MINNRVIITISRRYFRDYCLYFVLFIIRRGLFNLKPLVKKPHRPFILSPTINLTPSGSTNCKSRARKKKQRSEKNKKRTSPARPEQCNVNVWGLLPRDSRLLMDFKDKLMNVYVNLLFGVVYILVGVHRPRCGVCTWKRDWITKGRRVYLA